MQNFHQQIGPEMTVHIGIFQFQSNEVYLHDSVLDFSNLFVCDVLNVSENAKRMNFHKLCNLAVLRMISFGALADFT